MRTKWILSCVIVAAMAAGSAAAQSGAPMDNHQAGMMKVKYAGCVTSVNHDASFLLTDVTDESPKPRHDMAMKTDSAMPMKAGSAMPMKDQMHPADPKMEAPASKAVVLAGSAKLKNYVGRKVSVTGALSSGMAATMGQDLSTLTVTSIKVVAKSCS